MIFRVRLDQLLNFHSRSRENFKKTEFINRNLFIFSDLSNFFLSPLFLRVHPTFRDHWGRNDDVWSSILRAATAKARGLERFRDQSVSLCARLGRRAISRVFLRLPFHPLDTFPTFADRCIISASAAEFHADPSHRRYSPLINSTDETRMKYGGEKKNSLPFHYQRFFLRSVSSSFFFFFRSNPSSSLLSSRRIFESKRLTLFDPRKENNEARKYRSLLENNSSNYRVAASNICMRIWLKRNDKNNSVYKSVVISICWILTGSTKCESIANKISTCVCVCVYMNEHR